MTQPQPTQQFTPLFSADLSISDELESDTQTLLRHLAVVEQCIRQMAEKINRLEAENKALKEEIKCQFQTKD